MELTNETKTKLTEVAQSVLDRIGFSAEVSVLSLDETQSKLPVIRIHSENESGVLIGKNGATLDALEHVIRILVNKKFSPDKISFILDINDYRKTRTQFLIDTARETADRVVQTSRSEALNPMSSYERRLVHMELASLKDIETESIGHEPRRRIVIKPSAIRV